MPSTEVAEGSMVVNEEGVNKWTLIKKPQHKAGLTGQDLETRMRELNDVLLQDVKDIGYAYSHKEEWRSGTGLLSSDAPGLMSAPQLQNSKRFASSKWRAWNNDYVLLEDLSRREIEAAAKQGGAGVAATKRNATLKREKLTSAMLSKLPGSTFAQPKSTNNDYFDFHAMGNRNDVIQIFTKSLGYDAPQSLAQSTLLQVSANVDPEAFGSASRVLKGGVINSGPARGPPLRYLTAACDVPPVDKPKGSPKLTGFLGGPRDVKLANPVNPGGGSPTMHDYLEKKGATGGFTRERRLPADTAPRDAPGVGTYDLPRMFETSSDRKPRDLVAVLTELQANRDYRDIDGEMMARLVGFGEGCSRQEHILYGMCLDGLCGRRSHVEISMLQAKNFRRMGVESEKPCEDALLCVPIRAAPGAAFKKTSVLPDATALPFPPKLVATTTTTTTTASTRKSTKVSNSNSLRESIGLVERQQRLALHRNKALREERRLWTRILVADPCEAMTPLHLAAYRDDFDTIQRMRKVGEDINLKQGDDQETPLHVAVRKGQTRAVKAILSTFRGIVKVDLQNAAGDTALHVAARDGKKELVEALCDADADCRIRITEGQLPLEAASKHSIKQVLRIHEDYLELQSELRDIQRKRGLHALSEVVHVPELVDAHNVPDSAGRPTTSTSSRPSSSKGSQRSRIMEIGDEYYEEARESIKTNSSLFRISSAPRTLADPKKNSYILGYFPQ